MFLIDLDYSPHYKQYIEHINSAGTVIPLCDEEAYPLYPRFNWVYNKLELCKKQGISAVPHGVDFFLFPAFSKPIMNMYGMSTGARKIDEWKEEDYLPGHFLMPYLYGEHWSIDCVILNGKVVWKCPFLCYKDDIGSFTMFSIQEISSDLVYTIDKWVAKYFQEFTGAINLEIIGNVIIECHLRPSVCFLDLYGDRWIGDLVILFKDKIWPGIKEPTTGFCKVLRVQEPGVYSLPDSSIEEAQKYAKSIQILHKEGEVTRIYNDENSFIIARVNAERLTDLGRAYNELANHLVRAVHNPPVQPLVAESEQDGCSAS